MGGKASSKVKGKAHITKGGRGHQRQAALTLHQAARQRGAVPRHVRLGTVEANAAVRDHLQGTRPLGQGLSQCPRPARSGKVHGYGGRQIPWHWLRLPNQDEGVGPRSVTQ